MRCFVGKFIFSYLLRDVVDNIFKQFFVGYSLDVVFYLFYICLFQVLFIWILNICLELDFVLKFKVNYEYSFVREGVLNGRSVEI